jgi:GNAT superfamily N-acetyltransferase
MVDFRPLTSGDMHALHDLEADVYVPALHVSDASFLRLMELYPEGAIGAFDEEGLCGYAFGVPVAAGTTLDLQVPLDGLAEGADTFYIHDVAVARRRRGTGLGIALGTRLVQHAWASGFTRGELISVQGSAPFWEKLGFRRVEDVEYAPGVPSTKMIAEW